MPVDHPATGPGEVRRTSARALTLVLSFLVTLGVLLVLAPMLRFSEILS